MNQIPRKFLISDLVQQQAPVTVWLQGTIEQVVVGDILIISDGTGKAKITKCETADGIIDKKSLSKGTYCCIIGTAVKTKGLPEVQAIKFLDLNAQMPMKNSWESEVRESHLFFKGKLNPSV